ncbi:MAG: flippase-like domain-containing protein [Archangium sp.]|nr:flippase-like domain-containing protein [Archangium sp.]
MNRWLKLFLSLLVTAVCLAWTFKGTNVDEMLSSLRSANWLVLVPYCGLMLIVHVCRTLRWGNLLSGLEKVPFKQLNEASAIGFMMLIVLPFRLGEFARPFLIAERSNIRRSAAMTSVVFERIVDGIVMAVLLRVLVIFIPDDAPQVELVRFAGNAMFALFFGGLVFLLIARWQHDRVLALMRATVGRVSAGLTERVVSVVDGFVSALKQLPDGPNLVSFFVLTALYWGANGVGMSLMASGFDCSRADGAACNPMSLTVYQGFVAVGVSIVGLMIPAGPGGAGTFHSAMKIALGLFLPAYVVNSSGVAFVNVLWVVQTAQQIIVGLFFLVVSNGSLSTIAGQLRDQQQQGAEKPS